MPDVKVTWTADPTAGITDYTVFFTLTPSGGSAQPSVSANVPRTPDGDANGYSFLYSGLVPAPAALNNGDQVLASVESTNQSGSSPLVAAPVVTIVTAPPPPPVPTGPLNVNAVQV